MIPQCLPDDAQGVQFFTYNHPTWPLEGIFYAGGANGAARFDVGGGVLSFSVAEVASWEAPTANAKKCCTQNCRQGRDCPLRSKPAKVAPVRPAAAVSAITVRCDGNGSCHGNSCQDCEQTAADHTNTTGDGYPLPLWPMDGAPNPFTHSTSEQRNDRRTVWAVVFATGLITWVVGLGSAGYVWHRWFA